MLALLRDIVSMASPASAFQGRQAPSMAGKRLPMPPVFLKMCSLAGSASQRHSARCLTGATEGRTFSSSQGPAATDPSSAAEVTARAPPQPVSWLPSRWVYLAKLSRLASCFCAHLQGSLRARPARSPSIARWLGPRHQVAEASAVTERGLQRKCSMQSSAAAGIEK